MAIKECVSALELRDSISLAEKALIGAPGLDLCHLIELMSVGRLLHAVLDSQLIEKLPEVVIELGLWLFLSWLGARLFAVVEVNLVDHGSQDAPYPAVLVRYVSQYLVHLLEVPVFFLLIFATGKLTLSSLDGSCFSRYLRSGFGYGRGCGGRFGGWASFGALATSGGLGLFGLSLSQFAFFLFAALDSFLFLPASSLLFFAETEELWIILAVGPQRPGRLCCSFQGPVILKVSAGLLDGLAQHLSKVSNLGVLPSLGLHACLVGSVRLSWRVTRGRSRWPVEQWLKLETLHRQQRVCLCT